MAGKYEDLGITQSKDGDYFDVIIPDLDLSTEYALQVAWVYADKTLGISEYSDPYTFITTGEQPLNKPRFLRSDLTTQLNALIVNWSGLDYLGAVYPSNFARVDVFVKGGTFGSDYVLATSFFKAGKKTIIAQSGAYSVKLRAVSTRGTVSDFSDEWSSNTSDPSEIIEPPTLPIGLSVSPAPFGISVNWGGGYQADDPFSGFKTIEVYATTNAGLGASTTTAFASSSLVANLTVTQSLNRQNVGIDNLKQALGLATSELVYAANVYFYYIAYNKNNEPYKVSGVPTYTRISATPLSPTKANLIDLENGIISIENLVAGNGKFTSWLRAGSATGGARIELNGGTTFPDGATGRSVLDGFTVYNSGNSPIFRASTTSGTVLFGGLAPSDITDIQSKVTTKTQVFRQATVPTSVAVGDLWINTADSTIGRNTIYIATSVGANSITATGWVVAKDLDISKALLQSGGFDSNGNINRAISIPVPNGTSAGSIYSVKSSYGASNLPGWFLGWSGTSANSVPVIDIGSDNAYLRWNGLELEVKGKISATTGYIGDPTAGWSIGDISDTGIYGISSLDGSMEMSTGFGGLAMFRVGNNYLTSDGGYLNLSESVGGTFRDIISTSGVDSGDGGKIYLGDYIAGVGGRAVYVKKSAQIAGGTENANSGGLRNMFTATTTLYNTAGAANIYSGALNGDVLLVYTP